MVLQQPDLGPADAVIVGLDAGHSDVRQAEHWLHDLVRRLGLPVAGLIACTHFVDGRVALSLNVPINPLPVRQSPCATDEHAERRGGRAVLYPGVDRLVGTLTVAAILAASAIERVTVLGGFPPGPGIEVLTRDFVRPQWMDGLLTLVTTPAPDGRIAPFEVPNPTPCCADHR